MADRRDRQMLLVAFLQASNCSNYTASWRHPETDPGFMDLGFYQDIAVILERGKFHLAFIDDRLAMPSRFGDSFADAVEWRAGGEIGPSAHHHCHGVGDREPGIGGNLFHHLLLSLSCRPVVRIIGPLHPRKDSPGTSSLCSTIPRPKILASKSTWSTTTATTWQTTSWRPRVRCGTPGKTGPCCWTKNRGNLPTLRRYTVWTHSGDWFQVRGPLTVPRPPQGNPVLIQAGQSPRGREFAARWGELLFVIYPTPEACKAYRDDLRRKAGLAGRDPESVKVAPAVYGGGGRDA